MAEVLPLSESELRLLGSLVRHKIRFMVVGLSAAALQGAPVVTEAVDLWFENLNDPKLIPALRAVGAAYLPPFEFNPPMLGGPKDRLVIPVLQSTLRTLEMKETRLLKDRSRNKPRPRRRTAR